MFGNFMFGNSMFGNSMFGNVMFGNSMFGNSMFGNSMFGNCIQIGGLRCIRPGGCVRLGGGPFLLTLEKKK
jgi:hypothetical protein